MSFVGEKLSFLDPDFLAAFFGPPDTLAGLAGVSKSTVSSVACQPGGGGGVGAGVPFCPLSANWIAEGMAEELISCSKLIPGPVILSTNLPADAASSVMRFPWIACQT
ncbi:hypothetical protein BST17_25610 [Mycolicibacterium bacteremicum]|uniref:Uncharacterized protein n=1 Tax=Mycolicibacterium bacteremicum TaxID=564198 RepID=A0A1W9YQC2_MYCBA|nr:hypothetical protein BST17_25610 [Mycolicibacterium bacteremicum]